MKDFIEECGQRAARGWADLRAGRFWRHVRETGLDRELYVALMTEVYHYTRHNSQNQALAAVGVRSDRLPLLRFCLRHAYEEAGHDLMVLNDLESVGVDPGAVRARRPLPETEAFIAYLYRVASERDATARLGYSFWAESCYEHIAEILDAMRHGLGLADRQMTFFVAHSEIDEDHFAEVVRVIRAFCTTRELREGLLDVLDTSLHLQGVMLDGVYRSTVLAAEAGVA